MGETAKKFLFDPTSLSTQKMNKSCRDMVTRIRSKTEENLGDHCCSDHKKEVLQSSVLVTGFMMMASELLRQTGPVGVSTLDRVFRTIVLELTGEAVPEAGPEGEEHG